MTRIKICGITNRDDARIAIEAGADAVGFVFALSPRRIAPESAQEIVAGLPPLVATVGVFMNQSLDEILETARAVGLHAVQLHGSESADDCLRLPCQVIKRFDILENETGESLRGRMGRYRVAACLLDPGAGDGRAFDWRIAANLPGPLILAGGLTARNVGSAIRIARPFAVDVCSGVEREPGRKEPQKVRAFIKAVRDADGELDK